MKRASNPGAVQAYAHTAPQTPLACVYFSPTEADSRFVLLFPVGGR